MGTSTVMAPTASSKAKTGKPQETDEIAKKTLKNAVAVTQVTTEPVAGTGGTIGNKDQTTTSARSRALHPSLQHSAEAEVENVTAPAISRENLSFSDVSSIGRKEGKASTGALTNGSSIGGLGAKVSERERIPSSSRLLAPTASSLAKMNGRMVTAPGTTESLSDSKRVSRIPVVKKQNTLTSITNNLTHGTTTSPLTSGKVFNNLLSPASFSSDNVTATENEIGVVTNPSLVASSQPPLQRQRTLSGRKPRISRSKVISRLATQRANTVKNGGPSVVNTPRARPTDRSVVSAGKTRSSLGTRINKSTGRSSHSTLRIASGGNDLLMSAKKRARQSEYYARRRSRVEGTKPGKA